MAVHKFVGRFWVRQGVEHADGRSEQRFYRPKVLSLEHPSQRLITAALLSDQCTMAAALAEFKTSEQVDWTAEEVFDSHMASLLYERVKSLKLESACAEMKLSNGTSFLDWLAGEARRKIVEYENMEQQFVNLLEGLAPINEHIVWLKGVVLSRTIYEQPYHRPSRDFDIVVETEYARQLFEQLELSGYNLHWFDNFARLSVPLSNLSRACIGPCPELEFSNEIHATKKHGASLIELKFDPLKSGLRMRELDRFFSECQSIEWSGKTFRAPALVDHLLIELFNMHRRGFKPWPWLYDVHLLSSQLTPSDWQEFVRRCKHEDVSLSAWAGLDLARDRLNSPVPEFVMQALQPTSNNLVAQLLTFTVGTRFVWNEKGMGELVLNALFLGAARRKTSVMAKILFPPSDFLASYYWEDPEIPPFKLLLAMAMHWLLIFFPRANLTSKIGRATRRRIRDLTDETKNT